MIVEGAGCDGNVRPVDQWETTAGLAAKKLEQT